MVGNDEVPVWLLRGHKVEPSESLFQAMLGCNGGE